MNSLEVVIAIVSGLGTLLGIFAMLCKVMLDIGAARRDLHAVLNTQSQMLAKSTAQGEKIVAIDTRLAIVEEKLR